MNTFAVSFLVRPFKSTKAFFIAFKTDTTVTKANHLSRNKKNNFCPAYLNTCRTKVIHSRLHSRTKTISSLQFAYQTLVESTP